MAKLGTWELKQVIDIVSKGVNSVLMNAKEIPSKEELETLANNLTEIYVQMISNLKDEVEEPDIKVKK